MNRYHDVWMTLYFVSILLGSWQGKLTSFQFLLLFALGLMVDYLHALIQRLVGVTKA